MKALRVSAIHGWSQGRRTDPPPTLASAVWTEAHADARALSASRDPLPLLGAVMALTDVAVIGACSAAAHFARAGTLQMPPEIVSVTALGAALLVNALFFSGAYAARVGETWPRQSGRALKCWTLVLATLLLAAYLTKTSDSYARTWAVLWYLGALAGLLGVRAAAAVQLGRLRAGGRLSRTVAIVDFCTQGGAVARHVRTKFRDEAQLVGVFRPAEAGDVANGIQELLGLSRLFRIDDVLVLTASAEPAEVKAALRQLSAMTANVHVCPSSSDLLQLPVKDFRAVFDVPAMTVQRRPFSGLSRDVKRLEDLLLSTIAIALLLPVMVVIAVLIRLETPGPAVFRQARQGFNNNVFTVFKFRTMSHHVQTGAEVPQATRNDRRVTRLGKLLRRTSLDELPQLINVLRGEMSLVGPRPHAVAHNQMYETLIDGYIARHKVKPGITGWAQVHGLRGETDTLQKMHRRVEFDIQYIDSWSVLLDLKILVMTCLTVLFDKHAY